MVSAASSYRQDDKAVVVAKDSVDGAALRANIRAHLSADRSPVTVLTGGTPRELGKRICEKVVPKRPADTPILLRPNIGGFDGFKKVEKPGDDNGVKGRITNPDFVHGVIDCLKARGYTRITMAEGWGATPKMWTKLIDISGYRALSEETGVPLVLMADDGHYDKEGDRPGQPLRVLGMGRTKVPTLLMPKILAEHLKDGLVIAVPKLKAHRFAVMSGGIKGLQGSVMLMDGHPAYRQKWRMHREIKEAMELKKSKDPSARQAFIGTMEIFAQRMATVLEVEAPHLVLMDAAPAMGGDGFQRLAPTEDHAAIGGSNVIMVDAVGARYLGLWDNLRLKQQLGAGMRGTSPLIIRAAQRFKLDLNDIKIEGDGAELVDKPRPVRFRSWAGFSIHTDPPAAASAHPATPSP